MAGKEPGRYYRTGITLEQLFDKFPDDAAAEQWFAKIRWPHGIKCPHCGSTRPRRVDHKTRMPYHCPDCRRYFSVKAGSVMQSSNLGYRKWALGMT